ncbi:hypothetical protein F01_10046 [Burkholderia cenocepacia]|nr:hypothetical protein F01_10046 [Burkholderia cenocepacia]
MQRIISFYISFHKHFISYFRDVRERLRYAEEMTAEPDPAK